ncbi:MAG: 5-methyltetrahydropteroyltriglutamate--homocysteine S-methyltransferase [Pseudomonadales bacterium]|nr:5-methyltetrahydropteroyltriglutamate--homocysteine S-methyltransferase [Pseudomonadales bacterium]
MKKNPPFRADHVGSLLRTPELHKARVQHEAGQICSEDLKTAENNSIREIVRIQQEAGLKVITDGEQRRTFFHVDFLEKISGVKASIAGYEIKFRGGNKDVTLAPPILEVGDKLRRDQGLATDDFRFLQSVTPEGHVAKVCIPSPSMLHFRGGRDCIDETAYPDLDQFFEDLARIYREEIAELASLGCRYLQLDDTNLAYLCDPEHRQRVSELGENPDELPALYARLISECVKDRPADMAVGIHLCRGNHRSAWAAEGGYEPVAEVMFNETDVDAFFLEYDDARSGGFSPLRFVPKDKRVVLGLVSSKVPTLESRDEIKGRIQEAAQFIDLEQCCLSPQCGFSSTHEGNDLSFSQQSAKLRLVADIAAEVWG